METSGPLVRTTNWQAAALSAAVPLLIAAGMVYAALQPFWDDDSGDWAIGLFVLIPLEFVRALVASILGDTFKNYRSAAYAVNYFLLSLGILAAMLLGFAAYMLGMHDFIQTMASARTWQLVLPVAAIIVADGLIALYFFRGDPGCQAARIEAAADDYGQLLGLAVWPTPLVIAAIYGILLYFKQEGRAFAAWLPELSVERLRAAVPRFQITPQLFSKRNRCRDHETVAAIDSSAREGRSDCRLSCGTRLAPYSCGSPPTKKICR